VKYNFTAYYLSARVFLDVAPLVWYIFVGTCCSLAPSLEHLNTNVADSTNIAKFLSNYTASHAKKNSQLHSHNCMNEDIRVYSIQQTLALSIRQLEVQEQIWGKEEESKDKYRGSYYMSFWKTDEIAKEFTFIQRTVTTKKVTSSNLNGPFQYVLHRDWVHTLCKF